MRPGHRHPPLALAAALVALAGCGAAREGTPDPATAEGRLELGQRALIEGRAGDATGHAREAVRLRPDWATAHTLLGQALRLAGGARDEELRAFERAAELQPGSVVAWANLLEASRRAFRPEREAAARARLTALGVALSENPNLSSGGPDGDRGVPQAQP